MRLKPVAILPARRNANNFKTLAAMLKGFMMTSPQSVDSETMRSVLACTQIVNASNHARIQQQYLMEMAAHDPLVIGFDMIRMELNDVGEFGCLSDLTFTTE